MKKAHLQLPVSRRAVLARIRRRLATQGNILRVDRRAAKGSDPDFWVVNASNYVADSFYEKDLEAFAREAGALSPFEKLADE